MATHLTVIIPVLFLAMSFGGPFVQSNRKELRTNEMNKDQLIVMDRHVRSKSVDPSQVVQLSWKPRFFLYRGFLSEEECDYLISRGGGTPKSDGNKGNFGISLDRDDQIGTRIEKRISAWTFLPIENNKSLRIFHFGPEDPKRNYDYFDSTSENQVGDLLLATVVLYLSNVSQGGQILFPKSENKMWSDCSMSSSILTPTRGNAIIFFNLHLNVTHDRTSIHTRCRVQKGEMWFATKFYYAKPISIEKDSSQSDGGDCTDEDDNCPRWAAIGECQRNSVFMIGSPDYYGTCRKSCNAC